MSFLTLFCSPLSLLFFIVAAGLALGKLRLGRTSLGIAGILFVAIVLGALAHGLMPEEGAEIVADARKALQAFSALGSSLFVSVIGMQAGLSTRRHCRNAPAAFAVGALMTLAGTAVMRLIAALDPDVPYTSLLGILCGALTSTPGLSGVCERLGQGGEEAIWGYGCAYLPGVLLTVFFAQFFSRGKTGQKTQAEPPRNVRSHTGLAFLPICAVALAGTVLGSAEAFFLPTPFGTTAWTLTAGLAAGAVLHRDPAHAPALLPCLTVCKQLGLALFFAGTGFSAGTRVAAFPVRTILYGALITLAAIFCGRLLCALLARWRPLHAAFTVAGGMTSSPAYGALIAEEDDASGDFSFAYLGSLLTLTVAIPLIV